MALAAAVVVTAAGCSRDVRTETFSPAAAGPLATTGEDAVIYGVPQTGAVYKVNADKSRDKEPLVKLDVKAQDPRGITGITVNKTNEIFVAYIAADGAPRVSRVEKNKETIIWQGPKPTNANSTAHSGGAIGISPQDRVTVVLGDRNDEAAKQGDSPFGKAVTIDPAGPADQRPNVIASNFVDPTAATYDPNGSLWVADNGSDMKIKLSRVSSVGDRGAVADAGAGPATGMAFFGGEEITLCSSGEPLLRRYLVNDAVEAIPHRVITRDCNGGVATLSDSRVVYATPTELRITV